MLSKTASWEPFGESLFQLELSRENKAEIFEHALFTLSEGLDEAAAILQSLQKWNPSVAAVFAQRSASTILDTPFRLIFPNSAFPSFDETGLYIRQYIAISYCWHSQNPLPHGSWPVSKPFVDAILADKDHPREGIWMDQLCIDQSSSVDKQRAVAAMDVIYRSCIRLVVLLEDVFLDEQETALHEKYNLVEGIREQDWTWRPEGDERALFASFFTKVNDARWWERAWCFHEFNVNEPWSDKRQSNMIHNATFIVNGPKGSTVKIKWVNLHFIMASAVYILPDIVGQVTTAFKGAVILSNINGRDDRENGWRSSLMARHNGVLQKGCMHLADQLSIMINMSSLALAYVGQALKGKDDLLYLSVLLALAAGEVYPLSMMSGRLLTLDDGPTWLSRHTVGETTIPRFKPGVKGIYRISTTEIELDTLFLKATFEKVQNKDLELTAKIFPETIKTTQPALSVSDASQLDTLRSDPDSALDKARRRFLASCIVNGYSFTARLWAQLKRDVVIANYNQGVFKDLGPDPALHSAAQQFIEQLCPVSLLLGISTPSIFTIDDAQLLLTWLTDPRSSYYIGMYTYRFQCTLDHQYAFVTAAHINENFNDGPGEELRAAVPIDLLNATCQWLRVWILRPAKGEQGQNRWRLVGKALLLGEPDLMAEARSSMGRENAVVQLMERTVVGG
ncbi:Nn.00g045070.m01.CDS01 [Neocucurbitaria sp. VM-36]